MTTKVYKKYIINIYNNMENTNQIDEQKLKRKLSNAKYYQKKKLDTEYQQKMKERRKQRFSEKYNENEDFRQKHLNSNRQRYQTYRDAYVKLVV